MSKPAGFVRPKSRVSVPTAKSTGNTSAMTGAAGGTASVKSHSGKGSSTPQAKPTGAGRKSHKTRLSKINQPSMKGLSGMFTNNGYKTFHSKNW